MKGIYLLLGSNLGDRESILFDAINHIDGKHGNLLNKSSLYESAAWGIENQPNFLNQVIEIESTYSPEKLLPILQNIEREMGRKKVVRWGERIIDIDILYFGAELISSKNLTVPHSQLQNRRFTLLPMCEIAPELIHPLLNKTQQQLLDECKDPLWVRKIHG